MTSWIQLSVAHQVTKPVLQGAQLSYNVCEVMPITFVHDNIHLIDRAQPDGTLQETHMSSYPFINSA